MHLPSILRTVFRKFLNFSSNTISAATNEETHRDNIGLTSLHHAAINSMEVHESVLECLLLRDGVDFSSKIEALELAGAMILLHFDDIISVTQAFAYWKEAFDIRERQRLTKDLILRNNCIIDWRTVEWTTEDQLLQLQHSPSEYKHQAILVGQRVLSGISSKAVLEYLWPQVDRYCKELRLERRIKRLLEISWIMLEASRDQDLRENKMRKMVVTLRSHLVWSLKELKKERNVILTSEALKYSLELARDTDRDHLLR